MFLDFETAVMPECAGVCFFQFAFGTSNDRVTFYPRLEDPQSRQSCHDVKSFGALSQTLSYKRKRCRMHARRAVRDSFNNKKEQKQNVRLPSATLNFTSKHFYFLCSEQMCGYIDIIFSLVFKQNFGTCSLYPWHPPNVHLNQIFVF